MKLIEDSALKCFLGTQLPTRKKFNTYTEKKIKFDSRKPFN